MRELVRLLYLVVVILPLALLFIGPLLVLAALRGAQRVGPIILDPGRRGMGRRVLALLLGLLLWLAVWGGLAMLLRQAGLPRIASVPPPGPAEYLESTTSVAPTPSPQSTREVAFPTSTPTAAPSPTPQPTATSTPTSLQGKETPPQQPTPTPTPGEAGASSPSPSPTSSPVPPAATPTPMPPAATPTPTATLTPAATLSPDQAAYAITAVETANELLRASVVQPSIGNLAALETLWRGKALAKAQAFAQDLSQQYLRPLEVTFVYLVPPVALEGTSSDTAVVISTETWTYTGPQASRSESFEFIYTLTRQDEGWMITDYTYRNTPGNLPPPGEDILPTTPVTATITTTTVITSQ